MNTNSTGKIQTIANVEILSNELMVQPDMNANISSGGGTLRRSHKSSSNSGNNGGILTPATPNKKSIATISAMAVTPTSGPVAGTPYMSGKHGQQIHSILKNKNHGGGSGAGQGGAGNCHVNLIAVDSAGIAQVVGQEPNPILPPKMYKNTSKYPVQSGGHQSTKIHTITRPNDLTTSSSQFSLLSINGGSKGQPQQSQYQQPTQLRTNIQGTLYNTKSLPRSGRVLDGEDGKSRISYRDHQQQHQQQQQQQQLQQSNNYPGNPSSTHTLPKNHHAQSQAQQIYGKITTSSRSVLNDVVNKVPSVINIPMPMPIPAQQQQQQQQLMPSSQPQKSSMSGSASLVKMSNSKSSLCNSEIGDGLMVEQVSGCHSNSGTLKKKKEINANEKLISSSNKNSSSSSSSNSSHHHVGCGNSLISSVAITVTTTSTSTSTLSCSTIDHGLHSSSCAQAQAGNGKPLPILTTSTNCTNPKEHFLPNDTSLDDDYLSECENCKAAGSGSRYYMDDEELDELPQQETMTLQRKLINQSNLDAMNDDNDQQSYYRVSSTLPTNTNKKIP